ncbi:MAG: fructose bisphosphate aldolase [Verrucomicrobiota bacterium JB022]|nr:fructose bisphosphate aldolase [Verrucomicrobiota bacterium JB022]
MANFYDQLKKMRTAQGFIAALDQSGGSTPKALREYGIEEDAYQTEAEMYDLVHQMRSRIISNEAFDERIIGAILFEATMERKVEGQPTATYLWEQKRIVPFLKVDQGMEKERDGVQLMKPMDRLDHLLQRAKQEGIFGTKMRSVIHKASIEGVKAVVAQQFEYARRICAVGLVPIVEPEVDIKSPTKAEAEKLLREAIVEQLDQLEENELVMLKLSLPSQPGYYEACRAHPNVVRVVALSGGYDREEANAQLSKNSKIIASFSRALLEGLTAQQSDEEFTKTLDASIESIYRASLT